MPTQSPSHLTNPPPQNLSNLFWGLGYLSVKNVRFAGCLTSAEVSQLFVTAQQQLRDARQQLQELTRGVSNSGENGPVAEGQEGPPGTAGAGSTAGGSEAGAFDPWSLPLPGESASGITSGAAYMQESAKTRHMLTLLRTGAVPAWSWPPKLPPGLRNIDLSNQRTSMFPDVMEQMREEALQIVACARAGAWPSDAAFTGGGTGSSGAVNSSSTVSGSTVNSSTGGSAASSGSAVQVSAGNRALTQAIEDLLARAAQIFEDPSTSSQPVAPQAVSNLLWGLSQLRIWSPRLMQAVTEVRNLSMTCYRQACSDMLGTTAALFLVLRRGPLHLAVPRHVAILIMRP